MSWFGGTPQSIGTQDVRTGEQMAQEARNRAFGDTMSQRYMASLNDPSFALGDPSLQEMQKQSLLDATGAKLGERGLSGPAAKSAMMKTVADWKLGQMQFQANERDRLRQSALQAYGAPTHGMASGGYGATPGAGQYAATAGGKSAGEALTDPNLWSAVGGMFGAGSPSHSTAASPGYGVQRAGERNPGGIMSESGGLTV